MSEPDYVTAPSTLAAHPHDGGVRLGTCRSPAHSCDAVVSLCRVGTDDYADIAAGDHIEVRLVDSPHPADNPHLGFVLADAAAVIKELRDEGKTVFVHCVAAQQRTPSVALAYSRLLGVPADTAKADLRLALPDLRGHGPLWSAAAEVRSAS
ncbi:MAG: dual specificity protein phosphatase family protein [Flavobacterium sp.]|nr:dual specificity protein phosphatase family protein [Aeromicrobium sp.]